MTDLQHLLTLAALMAGCGLLGGFVNYWGAPQALAQSESYPFLKRMSAGIAASFAVPLFLNMISSSLVADSKSDPLKLLVIAGFCIVAAISSKAFIESLSKRLLNQVEQLDKDQKTLREDVEPVLTKEKEPPVVDQVSIASRYNLDDDDKNVLKVLANPKWSMRSLSGIMKDTGFKDIKTVWSLTKLCNQALARKNTKDGKDWYLLPKSSGCNESPNKSLQARRPQAGAA
jgi:hypothetical protein